jgi:hypothetical protein
MTARHCFFREDNSQRETYKRRAAVTFHGINSHTLPVAITLIRPLHPDDTYLQTIPPDRDALIIDLKSAAPNSTQAEFRRPKKGERLALIGVNNYRAYSNIEDSIRASSQNSCYVAHITVPAGCIYHGCSTTPGFSGTPIISRDSGDKLVIVGIHLAGATGDAGCTSPSPSNKLGNIGIVLDLANIQQ